jgi:hypothetical protein
VSGPEHPYTLTSMNNIARALSGQGNYREAEQLHRQVLKLRTKVLGPEHPDTMRSVYSLAYVLQGLTKYNDASILYQPACSGFQRTLGGNHPTTLACSNHYTTLLDEMNRHGANGASVS